MVSMILSLSGDSLRQQAKSVDTTSGKFKNNNEPHRVYVIFKGSDLFDGTNGITMDSVWKYVSALSEK